MKKQKPQIPIEIQKNIDDFFNTQTKTKKKGKGK
jgi:hypothetical protein